VQDYTDPSLDANGSPTTPTSAELVELAATRRILSLIIEQWLWVLNFTHQSGLLHPATYAAQDLILDLAGDLQLRASTLRHGASDSEQLVSEQ